MPSAGDVVASRKLADEVAGLGQFRGLVRRRRAGRRRVRVVGQVLLAREHGRDVPRVLALRVLALALLVVEAAEQADERSAWTPVPRSTISTRP